MVNLIEKLSKSLASQNEAFLVEALTERFYLTGFKSSAGALLITKNEAYLLVDFRYGEAAKKAVKNCTVIVFDRLIKTLNALLTENKIEKLYIQAEKTTISRYNFLNENTDEKIIISKENELDKVINNMRITKSISELNKIKEAQMITDAAYNDVLNFIKPGVTEKEIALFIEFNMRKKGAEAVSFDLIAISGKNTSLPHGVPTDKPIEKGDFVTMDIGAVFEGYHSDMTRTVGIGEVSQEQKKIYDIVLEAHNNALEKVRSGISCEEIDTAARSIIEKYGYGEFYKHSTGHGVGLDIHEQPFVAPRCKTILSTGMVITIEPGIYLPDKFGVRTEDMVFVMNDTYLDLTMAPKKLIII